MKGRMSKIVHILFSLGFIACAMALSIILRCCSAVLELPILTTISDGFAILALISTIGQVCIIVYNKLEDWL
jgi:hypothetical protein